MKLYVSGSKRDVARAEKLLASSDAPACSCSSTPTQNEDLVMNNNQNNPTGPGALAGQSSCLTVGTPLDLCAAGSFPAYTAGGFLYVTNTPTRRDFDVPCIVAQTFFGDVAAKCRSAVSIIANMTVGSPESCNCTSQVESTTNGTSGVIEISASADEDGNCEEFTPGLLITIGFSNNTSPGPVSLTIKGTGSDGCPFEMKDIRVSLNQLGQGQLAVIFACNEQQRLYPVLGRMRTDVVNIPTGTTIAAPGITGPTTAPVFYPDESITVDINYAPVGTTVTVETLTLNHPTLSCLWANASKGWV